MRKVIPILAGCASFLSIFLGSVERSESRAASIDEWRLTSRVDGFGDGLATDSFTAISNPFIANHSVSLLNSSSTSNYFAEWDALGFFNFTVHGVHEAEGNNALFSRSTGTIRLTPEVSSVLTIGGEYNYMLGSGSRLATISGGVGLQNGQTVYSYVDIINTSFDPPNGQLAFQSNEVPLSAGVQYTLGYTLQLTSLGGSPTSVSHGNGFIHFELAPVPEPATGLMILTGLFFSLRRGHRA